MRPFVKWCRNANDWQSTSDSTVMFSPSPHTLHALFSYFHFLHHLIHTNVLAKRKDDVGFVKSIKPLVITPKSDYNPCQNQYSHKQEACYDSVSGYVVFSSYFFPFPFLGISVWLQGAVCWRACETGAQLCIISHLEYNKFKDSVLQCHSIPPDRYSWPDSDYQIVLVILSLESILCSVSNVFSFVSSVNTLQILHLNQKYRGTFVCQLDSDHLPPPPQ